MKNRKAPWVGIPIVAIMIVLVVALVFSGCAKPASQEQKTLKIGVISWLGWPNGVDMVHGIELMADMDNQNGGLEIGGERYNVEIIAYDSNSNQATEVAAVNRLVFEDKVKFILTEVDFFMPAWLNATEANKVLVCGGAADYMTGLTPDTHYSFNGAPLAGSLSAVTGWFCKNYPDKAKNIIAAYPDDTMGHSAAEGNIETWGKFGGKLTAIFYPAGAADLSSLGTKVKTLNPGAFMAVAGGPVTDALVLKAAYQAGYRGQLLATSTAPASSLVGVLTTEVMEGFINAAWAAEFDPALTQTAQEFKDAWIAKYEKWEGPEIQSTGQYACLRTALQQAGSLDADKVAAVISNGLKYESPTSSNQMISRPDLGNDRTVDSVATYYIKQIKEGKPTLLATIGIDEALEYFRMAYPPAQGE